MLNGKQSEHYEGGMLVLVLMVRLYIWGSFLKLRFVDF